MSVYMCQTVCFKYVIYFMPIIAQLRVNFSPLTFKNGNMCTFFFLAVPGGMWDLSSLCVCHFSHVRPYGLEPTRLLCPWDSPGKNTGAGCHAHLQGIFPTQGSNQHLAASPALQVDFFTH